LKTTIKDVIVQEAEFAESQHLKIAHQMKVKALTLTFGLLLQDHDIPTFFFNMWLFID